MKRVSIFFVPSIFSVILLIPLQDNLAWEERGVITQDLENRMEEGGEEDWIRINIAMNDQINRSYLESRGVLPYAPTMNPLERRKVVVDALKTFTQKDQAHLLRFLKEKERVGGVRRIRSLWIANVISAEVKKGVIPFLSKMEGIRSIDFDEKRNLLLGQAGTLVLPTTGRKTDPVDFFSKGEPPPRITAIEWNISLINAPAVWALGYTGQGVVVGNIDTGVNYDHWDLRDHVWTNSGEVPSNSMDDDGNGYIDDFYGFDFNANQPDPMDDHGHGTHTAGTVAGDGSAGTNTGVAPDAQIMCLKVLDAGGYGYESDVWESVGYAINNGAHILTISLGWMYIWNPDRQTWRNTFINAHLAGVISSVAAGNEGGLFPPFNLRTPGDVPPPWLHPQQTLTGGLAGVVTAGATDSMDNIADFSSRGPVSWETISPWFDYPYGPEMGLLDPDVSAPGVCVTSLRFDRNNQYFPCWNGTSMATPHVAGLMALMLQKNPNLSPALLDSIIETTAIDLGSPGKDNDYGSGRIDALAAVNAVFIPTAPFVRYQSHTLADTSGGDGDGRPEGSETVEMVVNLENLAGYLDATLVQASLSTSDPTLTLLDSSANFPDIPSGSSGDNSGNPFLFTVDPGIIPHWANFYLLITAEPGSFSRTDSFTVRVGRPEILLVDDDEGANYGTYYTEPLDNLQILYDEWSVVGSGAPGDELSEYSCVIWFTGDDSITTLTPQEESDLTLFLDGGGNLFISGQNIGQDIGGTSTFYSNYLKAVHIQDNADDNLLTGVPGDPISDNLSLVITGPNGAGNAFSEDKISPLPPSTWVFTYTSAGGVGAIKHDPGSYRVVYFSFPFEAISGAGSFASRDTVMARVLDWICPAPVGIEEESTLRIPHSAFQLFQNHPNPFHSSTTIHYTLPAVSDQPSVVRLAIYDITGRLVETLVDGPQGPGIYQLPISNHQLPGSGIYFYRLEKGDLRATKKLLLLR